MDRLRKDAKRTLLVGAICLALVAGNVPVADAATGSTRMETSRTSCWLLCW